MLAPVSPEVPTPALRVDSKSITANIPKLDVRHWHTVALAFHGFSPGQFCLLGKLSYEMVKFWTLRHCVTGELLSPGAP